MSDLAPSQKLEELLGNLKLPDDSHATLFVTRLIETLRVACAGQGGVYHLMSFLTACGNIKWDVLPFDLFAHLQTSRAPGVTDAVYLQALGVFLNVLADDPDYATETTFNEILQALAVSEKPKAAPEIFQPQMLSRVFDSKVISDDDLLKLDARFVLYQHVYATGKISHQLRGLAFAGDRDQFSIVLESGEFLEVAKEYPHLISLTISDGHVVPATLLAYTYVLAKDLADRKLISMSVFDAIETQHQLGKLANVATKKQLTTAAVEVVQDAIDNPHRVSNTAAPNGLRVRAQIGDRIVLLHATQAANGAQVFASVLDEKTDRVLMRLDYPRTFSARGIYMFPLAEDPVFVTVL